MHGGKKDMGAERRRSKRVPLAFQIEVSGKDRAGRTFREHAVTRDINANGCQFEFVHRLYPGDLVTIRLPSNPEDPNEGQRFHPFEVVWIVPSEYGWKIGAAKLDSDSIWPLNFPADSLSAGKEASARANVESTGLADNEFQKLLDALTRATRVVKLRMSLLDDFPVQLTCPSCGDESLARIHQLKHAKSHRLPCGHSLLPEVLDSEIAAAERQLKHFKQNLKRPRS